MKFLRYLKKKRRAMLALAALTFFSNPFAAQASNITTKAGVTLNPTNNVYNIEVQQKLSNAVGVNKFTDFTLDSGHIANMQFGTLQTLANLVDNKININGTVNALRNGKIGGAQTVSRSAQRALSMPARSRALPPVKNILMS